MILSNKTGGIPNTGPFVTHFLPRGKRPKHVLIRFVNLISKVKSLKTNLIHLCPLKPPLMMNPSDVPMRDYESSTPLASSLAPSSGPLTISSAPGSFAISRSTSTLFQIGKSATRSNPRRPSTNSKNPTELLKKQIAQAFQFISCTIHQSHDENQIPLEALSDNARVQYANPQLLQRQLAKGKTIGDKELSDTRRALSTLEGVTRVD